MQLFEKRGKKARANFKDIMVPIQSKMNNTKGTKRLEGITG